MSKIREALEPKDFSVLEELAESLKELAYNEETMEKLRLQNKAGGLLAEIFAVLKLHEQYEDKPIVWYGGQKTGIDLELGGIGIQVKKMADKYEHFYYWRTRNEPKTASPWLFVNINEKLQPEFFCVSKSEMKEFAALLVGERKYLVECRKENPGLWRSTGKGDGGNPEYWLKFFDSQNDLKEYLEEWKKNPFSKVWPAYYETKTGMKELALLAEDYRDKFNKFLE